MKNILTSILLVFSITGFSQSSNKYYFDGDMHPQPKSKAEIYGTGQMDSGLYQLTCYYMKRKHPLACVAHYADSTQQINEGRYQFYYVNGLKAEEGSMTLPNIKMAEPRNQLDFIISPEATRNW